MPTLSSSELNFTNQLNLESKGPISFWLLKLSEVSKYIEFPCYEFYFGISSKDDWYVLTDSWADLEFLVWL